METLHSIKELGKLDVPIHLAAGVFDGIHLGHQAVIASALEGARLSGGTAVVLTFHPHPVKILRPEKAPRLLTSTRHKILLIERLGVHALLVQNFTPEFARTEPSAFVEQLAIAAGSLAQICVGQGWTFGVNRSGTVDLLKSLADRFGFSLTTVAPVTIEGQIVSSTLVRSAIEVGQLDLASKFLGRLFTIFGTVSEGMRLGRQLGFPTANLHTYNEQFPPNGVYAVLAWLQGELRGGVVNIGIRPTLTNQAGERILELHLFDFDQNIYGEDIEVCFLDYLRPEIRFPDLGQLQAQISRDATKAREICRERLKTGHGNSATRGSFALNG
jgi:riboflavin kinase / FMN adenylyltransferase